MGHIPPTPDLYFPECVSHSLPRFYNGMHNSSIVSEAEFFRCCVSADTDLDPLFRLVLPIYRDLTPIPGYNCWAFVWGKLSLFERQI